MNKLLIASFFLISSFVSAQSPINPVNNGQAIQAAKFNEVIEKVNVLSTELEETKNKLAIAEAKVVPVGSVISMAGNCPSGYLEANGNSLSRSTNVALFNAIGTVHGFNDANTFRLPDYRGRFLRGVSGDSGNDGDAAGRLVMNIGGANGNNVGSIQGDAIRNISGQVLDFVNNRSQAESGSPNGAFYGSGNVVYNGSSASAGSANYPDKIYFDASIQVPTGSDNRPRNAYVRFCIKSN